MKTYDELKPALKTSKFRSGFKLDEEEKEQVRKLGLEKLELHAKNFITKRIAPKNPKNDGKQTPWKGHPIFKAQHATGICCRNCLEKWHKIPKSRDLTLLEIDSLAKILVNWVKDQL